MAIERDSSIRFHELGTLTSVTRWISSHDEGLAEWLKNARRTYQRDRANVDDKHRTAVLLFKDKSGASPARIGLLDVGGATLDDVTAWSVWQDPDASSRGSSLSEEETQGNGGKTYMYRLFDGLARVLGVREKKLNCKGFEGPPNSLGRGTPGFMPTTASGCDLPIVSWEAELANALEPFDLVFADLPKEVQDAIHQREAFTLVEGVEPRGLYKGRIDAEDLVQKFLRHDQSTLAVQQLRAYAAHNGRFLNCGKPLELEIIAPYAGFEQPVVCEIPEELPDANGNIQSTTLGGERPRGRLILYTSQENMPNAYKKLKPRWKVTYRSSSQQMIGSKLVSELVPNTPGSQYIYAAVELHALEPDYVELGRKRPNDGPLVQALDLFISERIRALAKSINDRQRHELDERELDEVHEENQLLNNFKNRFLPSGGSAGDEVPGTDRKGPSGIIRDVVPRDYGEVPDSIELEWTANEKLRVGRGVKLPIGAILKPRVLDASGKLVAGAEVEWFSDDRHVVKFGEDSSLSAPGKGVTNIWARVKGTAIVSPRIEAHVWIVDHVLLTPRTLEIQLGRRKQIIAEVTSDEGDRATNVYLNWKHDADDQLIVRIQPTGWISGNRLGKTSIIAGAGESGQGDVWARIAAEVTVVTNPDGPNLGGGFPDLRLTDRDKDPDTGEVRQGDPEQPALWQEVWDYQNNIWWLNLQSPDASFFFSQRGDDIKLWRAFHAQKVVEMVIQVHMAGEFNAKGEEEQPDLWTRHKQILESKEIQLKQAMWDRLKEYVGTGGGLS
jgi:hypothetical protein